MLEMDLLIRRGDYSKAMEMLEELATKFNEEEADTYQRVKLMILKAQIYEKSGLPQKAFPSLCAPQVLPTEPGCYQPSGKPSAG